MAKKSAIERNNKRIRMAELQREKRSELRKITLDMNASDEEREAARVKLHKLPANGSVTRVRRRCQVTGRPRGVYRKFSLCRIKIREYASMGFLPGVTKSSW